VNVTLRGVTFTSLTFTSLTFTSLTFTSLTFIMATLREIKKSLEYLQEQGFSKLARRLATIDKSIHGYCWSNNATGEEGDTIYTAQKETIDACIDDNYLDTYYQID
jgi:hypothetical protein